MSPVLILTVGASGEPLVKSIKQSKPDYTIFICSTDKKEINTVGSEITVDGAGKPCKTKDGEARESIVAQTGLKTEQYEKVFTKDLDDLAACYRAGTEAILKAQEKKPGSRIRIDYTGGTKSMSAGLAAAGLDHENIEFFIVSGPRTRLTQVSSGTEMLRRIDWTPIVWMRQKHTLEELFSKQEYAACADLIENLCGQLPGRTNVINRMGNFLSICRGFQAWEEFRHQEALSLLKVCDRNLGSELKFLSSVIKSHQQYEQQIKAALGEAGGCATGVKPNLSLVHDIMRNAERRLQKEQYDDAVGRIYRALELLAQICLLYHDPPIYTSRVKIEKLPSHLQDKYREIQEQQGYNGKHILQLPLYRAYELLNDLEHPLGKLVWERKEKMRSVIETRNESIFAHGLKPVERQKAQDFYEFVRNVLVDGEAAMKLNVRYDNQARFPEKPPISLDVDWE